MHPVVPVLLVALSHCMGIQAQIPPFLLEVPGRVWADTPKTREGTPGQQVFPSLAKCSVSWCSWQCGTPGLLLTWESGSCRTGRIRARAEIREERGGAPCSRQAGDSGPGGPGILTPLPVPAAARTPGGDSFSVAPGRHSKRGRKLAGARSRLPTALFWPEALTRLGGPETAPEPAPAGPRDARSCRASRGSARSPDEAPASSAPRSPPLLPHGGPLTSHRRGGPRLDVT